MSKISVDHQQSTTVFVTNDLIFKIESITKSDDAIVLKISDNRIIIECDCLDLQIYQCLKYVSVKSIAIDRDTLRLRILKVSKTDESFVGYDSNACYLEKFDRDQFLQLVPEYTSNYAEYELKPMFSMSGNQGDTQFIAYSKELYNHLVSTGFELVDFLDKIQASRGGKSDDELKANVTLCLLHVNNLFTLNCIKQSMEKYLTGHPLQRLVMECFNSVLYDSLLVVDINIKRKQYLESFFPPPVKNNENSAKSVSPDSQMIKVYNQKFGFCSEVFKLEPETAEFPTIKPEVKPTIEGSLSVVPTMELFNQCFSVFSNNVLSNIDWGKGSDTQVVVAGGSINACIDALPIEIMNLYINDRRIKRLLKKTVLPPIVVNQIFGYYDQQSELTEALFKYYHDEKSPFVKSDMDLFVVTDSIEKGKKKIEELAEQIRDTLLELNHGKSYWFVRSQNSITILSEYPFRPIQLMVLFVKSVDELLLFFDMDCACCAYDGETVSVLPRTINSLNKRVNLVPPKLFKTSKRLWKYSQRGYDLRCFEYCKHYPRCDQGAEHRDMAKSFHYLSPSDYDIGEMEYSDYIERYVYGPGISFTAMTEILDYHYQYSLHLDEILNIDIKAPEFTKNQCSSASGFKPFDWRFYYLNAQSAKFYCHCYMCGHKWIPLETLVKDASLSANICQDCSEKNRYPNLSSIYYYLKKIPNRKQYAIVTGGRIKIGFETALLLLRAGFHVIVTSRFPYQTQEKFKKYGFKKEQLSIYGVDFRNLASVQQFIDHVKSKFPRIDILVNNAAQTIRRPRAYYNSLITSETQLSQIQSNNNHFIVNSQQQTPATLINDIESISLINNELQLSNNNSNNHNNNSISLVKTALIPEDIREVDYQLFPANQYDDDGEQLDLREKTSWVSRVEEISTLEMAEVQLVNVTVPFMLISQLACKMGKNTPSSVPSVFSVRTFLEKRDLEKLDWSFIINVTSPEGSMNNIYNQQSGFHCHTNMAKASLNMLTRTTAQQFESMNIYTCGVDVGWISHMKPQAGTYNLKTPPPLNNIDGAKRIVYPIFESYYGKKFKTGVLFKNFDIVDW
eukprot:gene3278-4106_t